jgi:hypothetical protein
MPILPYAAEVAQQETPATRLSPRLLRTFAMVPSETPPVWTGEQRLAFAVLQQAVTDLHSPYASTRASSHAFFQDVLLRTFWGEVLGVEDGLTRYAQRLATQGDDTHAE